MGSEHTAAALYLWIPFRARPFISFNALHLLALSHTNGSDGFTCILLLHASLERWGMGKVTFPQLHSYPTALMQPLGKHLKKKKEKEK